MRIGHGTRALIFGSTDFSLWPFVMAQIQNPQTEVCATQAPERASAPRLCRDAVRALATGRVALAFGKPSQGRRSLSRIPASGPQGFWPAELNLNLLSCSASACR